MRPRRHARFAPLSFALLAALSGTGCEQDADGSTAPASASPSSDATPAAADAGLKEGASVPVPMVAYDCAGTVVQASFDGDTAALLLDGETIPMAAVPSASGARYQGLRADGVPVELWTKGDGMTLAIAGHSYPDCRRTALAVETADATYRARGTEPFWSIEAIGNTLRWTTIDAPEPIVWSDARRTDREDGFDIAATRDGAMLALSTMDALCRDRMTGMPYPHTVTVRIAATDYRGCGGDPRELLLGREWSVSIIDDASARQPAPTLRFTGDGGVGGFGGCNRWRAAATLSGEGLRFGQAASTMMACDAEAMAQERAFLDALATVTRHDFDAAGALLLKAGDTTVLVAMPGLTLE